LSRDDPNLTYLRIAIVIPITAFCNLFAWQVILPVELESVVGSENQPQLLRIAGRLKAVAIP
jgi:hypothetical protein